MEIWLISLKIVTEVTIQQLLSKKTIRRINKVAKANLQLGFLTLTSE